MTRNTERVAPPPAGAGGGARVRRFHHTRQVDPEDRSQTLTPHHAKAAFALGHNLQHLFTLRPLSSFVFLTLTFPEAVSCHVASKRFHSLRSNWLTPSGALWAGTSERTKRDWLHFHLLLSLDGHDFACNFDWDAHAEYIQTCRHRPDAETRRKAFIPVAASAPQALKDLWSELRKTLPGYGFGRHEALPIRKSGPAVAAYVSKYLSKHIGQRRPDDVGAKTIFCCAEARRNTTTLAWCSPGATAWRKAVGTMSNNLGMPSFSEMFEAFLEEADPQDPERFKKAALAAAPIHGLRGFKGPHWAWECFDAIMSIANNEPTSPPIFTPRTPRAPQASHQAKTRSFAEPPEIPPQTAAPRLARAIWPD